MRAVVQRTLRSSVTVGEETVGRIGPGLTVLLGVGKGDTDADMKYIADKILNLRIFEDDQGKLNRSLLDVQGEILLISQFTLYGDVRKGRRPGFDMAAPPEEANRLYEAMAAYMRGQGVHTETGRFQSEMIVSLDNHGPVTILLDSQKTF